MKLNDKQLEAVNHINGPLIVIAGAGSGKTSVLTNRIVNLLNNGVRDTEILAITFTNKAAKEMRDRTQQLINNNCLISTFHSFCFRILKQHANYLGYGNNITILDDEDLKRKLKDINEINGIGLDVKEDLKTSIFLKFYVNKKYLGINLLNYYKNDQFEKLYDIYVKESKRDSFLNFEDLLYLTVELFTKNKDLLDYYQEKYKYILVDEYQDTNDVQNDLILLLSSKYKNVFIVGDEDQSIYAFRGANVDNLKNFKKTFKDAKIVKLEENYRSTNSILRAANEVIKANPDRIEKNLWTSNDSEELIKLHSFDTEYEELDFLIDKIKTLKEGGVSLNNIAILYRSGFVSKNIEKKLGLNGIKYVVYGGFDFFRRTHVKQTMNYLNAILNPNNRHSMLQIINFPSRKIGTTSLREINDVIDNVGDIHYVFSNPDEYFSKGLASKIFSFYKLILDLREELEKLSDITEIIDLILKKVDLEKVFLEMDNGKERLQDVLSLKDIFSDFEGSKNSNLEILQDVLEEVNAIYNHEDVSKNEDRLILSTIHQSKGLEFDYVFLPFFDEGIIPSFNAIKDSEKAIEEERRLCYVAITRAKKELFITRATERLIFGKRDSYKQSRFLEEIPEEIVEKHALKIYAGLYNRNRGPKKQEPYKTVTKGIQNASISIGDKVKHVTFGEGIIVAEKSGVATIAFSVEHGLKNILITHNSLTKC